MPEEKSQPKITIQKSATGIAKAIAFIKDTLGEEGRVIKAVKTADGGWEVEVEVIEQSEYMKRIGIPKPVYDKNVYQVIMDKDFNVNSYERKSRTPGEHSE